MMGRVQLHPARSIHAKRTSTCFLTAPIDWSGVIPDKSSCRRLFCLLLSLVSPCFHRAQLLTGNLFRVKSFRIKWLAAQPHRPHRLQNLALSVEPGVPHTAGAKSALLVKALERIGPGSRFAGGTPGVIGEVFQLVISAPVQPLVA